MTFREKNKITYIYFILSILVILIHSVNNESRFERFFSINCIVQFATVLFFIISGFLFFRNLNNIYDVRRKLEKRVWTLLIPYLLWNLIYYVVHLIMKPGEGIDIFTIYDAAVNYKHNPAFWFVYQLILLNILSLLFIYILKDIKYIVAFYVVMAILIISATDIPYINEDAIIYYFSGAVFSKLYNKNKVSFISKKNFFIMLLITSGLFVINRFLYRYIQYGLYYYHFIFSVILVRLSASFSIFYMIDFIFNYRKTYAFMENTFFLYSIHYMIVRFMVKCIQFLTIKIIPNSFSYPIEILFFVMSPLVCIVVSFYLSRFMKKRFLKVYNILTGKR
ncbi:MAG: acyltransferase family protein [Lachnospiraceae bacterium]|nr:acyltransferase family protein [Lachnospiraceae bacterium]